MRVQSYPHATPPWIRPLAKGEPPDQAVDLRRLALPAKPETVADRPVLGLVHTVEQQGSRDYNKLVKGAEAAYNFAVKDVLVQVPGGVDATVRGGLVLWDGIEIARQFQNGKVDAVDLGLTLVKAGANAAALLDSLGVVPINPLWTKGIIAGCSVILAVKGFHDSGKPSERTLVYTFEPEDMAKLPKAAIEAAAGCSMGLAAAALAAGGHLSPATPGAPPPGLKASPLTVGGPLTAALAQAGVKKPAAEAD